MGKDKIYIYIYKRKEKVKQWAHLIGSIESSLAKQKCHCSNATTFEINYWRCHGWRPNGNKFLSFRCALKSRGGASKQLKLHWQRNVSPWPEESVRTLVRIVHCCTNEPRTLSLSQQTPVSAPNDRSRYISTRFDR